MSACPCGCGEWEQTYIDTGYPYCPACMEHHRPWSQCPGITPDGKSAEGAMELEGEMNLEEWLDTVPAEALRELTNTNAHGWRVSQMKAHILATPEARQQAEESKRIMESARR